MILTLSLSLLIGLLLGLLGGGGSILTVPMLVYILKVDPKTAIVTSLVVVGTSSLIAIIPHAHRNYVCWKCGFIFGLAGMAGAYSGGRLAGFISGDILMAIFGLVTLLTGLAMLRVRHTTSTNPDLRQDSAVCPLQINFARVLFDGFLVGIITGLVGVGGGFLIVPALTLLVGLPMQSAIGTSLLIIAMNSIAGLAGYAKHVAFDVNLAMMVTGGAVVGAVVGGIISKRISASALRRMFGLFVMLIAGYVLFQSLTLALLTNLIGLLEKHLEFVMGIATLAIGLALFRFGQWIHQKDNEPTYPTSEKTQ